MYKIDVGLAHFPSLPKEVRFPLGGISFAELAVEGEVRSRGKD